MGSPDDGYWAQLLDQLDHWVDARSSADVPQAAITYPNGKPYRLGTRVNDLRKRYAANKLAPARVFDLEQRPG